MKRNVILPALLSLALTFSGFSAFGKNQQGTRSGHRGGARTEQTRPQSQKRPGQSQGRPGGNQGNNQGRPGGNHNNGNNPGRPGGNHNNGNHGNGNHGNVRPGNNSKPRPGSGGQHGNFRPGDRPHHNMRPTPPPPGPPRPHPSFHGYRPRPSFGINVSFAGLNLFYSNGLYYNRYSPTQYVVTLPPVGMIVSSLYNPVYQWYNNGYYYLSQGVVYLPIQTSRGLAYEVVDYYL